MLPTPLALFLISAVGTVLVYARGGGDGDVEPGGTSSRASDPKRIAVANEVEEYAKKLVAAGFASPSIVGFFVAAAWTESNWSWGAGTSSRSNKARGILGMRPETAYDRKLRFITNAQLAAMKTDKPLAMALAFAALTRLSERARRCGVTFTVERARCGWALPSLVCDDCRAKRPALFKRWDIAARNTNLPPGFLDREIRIDWPGFAEVLKVLNG